MEGCGHAGARQGMNGERRAGTPQGGTNGPQKKKSEEVGMGSWKVEWGNETEGDSGEAEEIRERT